VRDAFAAGLGIRMGIAHRVRSYVVAARLRWRIQHAMLMRPLPSRIRDEARTESALQTAPCRP
jgi:hypothetical protein